jgi:rod shape determining protein RodA
MVLLDRPVGSTRRQGQEDWVLALATVIAAGLGLIFIYTATKSGLAVNGLDGKYFLKRQATFDVLGVVIMLVLWRVDYRRIEQIATPAYAVSILMLLAVLSPLGSNALGAQRWFALGPLQIQPSEFTVLAVIMAFATYCNRRPDGLTLRDVSRLLLMVGFPMLLIIVQPDLGTVIIILIVFLVMMAAAGLPGRLLLWLVIGVVLAVIIAIEGGFLSSYQIHRLTSFLNQNSSNPNLQQSIYNVKQAKDAIGSGGLFGAGLGQGAQTNLGYVPEQQTDFIFTAVGEQVGFLGSLSVVSLMGFIGFRILRGAFMTKDVLGRVVCSGIFAFFSFSVFQNAGMTMGIMPVTGIPLPFFSYGGSAAIVFFTGIGMVLSIEARRGGG